MSEEGDNEASCMGCCGGQGIMVRKLPVRHISLLGQLVEEARIKVRRLSVHGLSALTEGHVM